MSLYYIPVIRITSTKLKPLFWYSLSLRTRACAHTRTNIFQPIKLKQSFIQNAYKYKDYFLSYRELNSQYIAATNDTKCLDASSWAAHKMIWSFYLPDNAYSLSDPSFFLWIPLEDEFAWWRKCYFRTMFTITVLNGT